MMPNFQALAASLEGADAQSDEGRRQILAAAFESGCDLVLRVLLGPRLPAIRFLPRLRTAR